MQKCRHKELPRIQTSGSTAPGQCQFLTKVVNQRSGRGRRRQKAAPTEKSAVGIPENEDDHWRKPTERAVDNMILCVAEWYRLQRSASLLAKLRFIVATERGQ